MLRLICLLALLVGLEGVASPSLFACEATVTCDRCAKDSEFSWNPENRYVSSQLARFYELADLIEAAYKGGNYGQVEKLASEYLALAKTYRCNWSHGNAIHDANRFLGLVSIRNGNIEEAAEYLLQAGKSTGSPQLNTFGPRLDLANELLKQGKRDAVAAYLDAIQSFWKMNGGLIEEWSISIRKGETPDLEMRTQEPSGPLEILWSWFSLLWPGIVPIGIVSLKRNTTSRKAWFFAVATLLGFLSTIVIGVIAGGLFPFIVTNLATRSLFIYTFSITSLLAPLAVSTFIWRKYFRIGKRER